MPVVLIPLVIIQAVLHFLILGLSLLLRAKKLEVRTWRSLIALDRYANSITGGYYGETISSRLGKGVEAGNCKTCCILCRILSWFEKDHCKKSIGT